jgi:hypothetical protein
MATCDTSSLNEKSKATTSEMNYGACAMDPEELFSEHDVDYIHSQLTNPVDRQLIRDTLNDNQGDIDGTIAYLLALDIPPSPQPSVPQESDESIEKITSVTGIYDIDLVQQSFAHNNFNIDLTIEALLKLRTDDNEKNEVNTNEEKSENEQTTKKSETKTRSVPNRQIKIDKKKAKKQRAIEKHRAQIVASSTKTSTKLAEEKSNPPDNNEQEHIPPANMEFISI